MHGCACCVPAARGSVFRRSGGWAYRIDVGFQPGTDNRRQALKQGFTTKKAAELAMAEAMSASVKGMGVPRSTIRVADFLTEWLAPARSKLRPTTYYSYEVAVGRINAHLGWHQHQSLTPMQIENFYATQLNSGGRGWGPLKSKTVRNTHVVLRRALSDAELLGLVPRNAAAARPPTPVRSDLITWSSAELGEFLAAVKDDRRQVAFVLVAPMTTISPDQDVMTLINVFTVDPARCDELVQVLVEATDVTMRHLDGFVSANIHRSLDGHRVVNYARWKSVEPFNAMRENAKAAPHMERAAKLANAFGPIVCTVADATSSTPPDGVEPLYRRLLQGWNECDAVGFDALVADEGSLAGC